MSMGLLTPVDEVEIPPKLIADYIRGQLSRYDVQGVAIDDFRYTLMREALEEIGLTTGKRGEGDIKLVKPSDIMRVIPVIDSVFVNQRFIWDNNPMLRWATNNTKKVASSRKIGMDTGNYIYAKIEAKSRKTDPFMALVASMTIEDRLQGSSLVGALDLGALIDD